PLWFKLPLRKGGPLRRRPRFCVLCRTPENNMASRFAMAALLSLVISGWATGIQIESAVDEGSEDQRTKEGTWVHPLQGRVSNPRSIVTIKDAPQPLTPFGEASLKAASQKARKALLSLSTDEKKQHMYDAAHSYIQGGPPQNKFGDTFDIPLKSQV
ncbi:unnamed protein product, partial [Prorocentrum cordatum]